MDPVTIIGGATVAFNALKKGFQVGKDLQDMSGQLTQWAGCMSDLSFMEAKNKNPPWWKALNGGSVEADALAIFTAKRKADSMRQELKDWISFSMGPSAWDELVATEGRIRKQKKEQEYRKAEIQEAIVTWSISGVLLSVARIQLASSLGASRSSPVQQGVRECECMCVWLPMVSSLSLSLPPSFSGPVFSNPLVCCELLSGSHAQHQP